jgi:hypothetical protein
MSIAYPVDEFLGIVFSAGTDDFTKNVPALAQLDASLAAWYGYY